MSVELSEKKNLAKENAPQFAPVAGKLPPPEVMADYAAIDPSYPEFLKETFRAELRRNFVYQMVALGAGWLFGMALVGGAVFLAYTNHPKMALTLVGANCLGLASRMLAKSVKRE